MRLTPNQQQALDIERHICVTAGAGSGKTAVLVERYLKILREGNVTPREIVAITFTEKAAAEMKARVIEKLNAEEDRETRESLLEQMNTAPISTIHSFCSRILREFPFQADVPANFSILPGIDQKLLLQDTLRKTLKEIATNTQDRHRAELHRLLQRYINRQNLEGVLSTMVGKRDVIAQLIQEIYSNPNDSEICNIWERHIADAWVQCLKPVLEIARGQNVGAVQALTDQLVQNCEAETGRSTTREIREEIAVLITTQGNNIARAAFLGRGVDTTDIDAEIKFLVSAATAIKTSPSLETDADETDDDFLISTTRDLLTLYTRILNAYRIAKLSQGKLDFNDLQLKTRDLLRDKEDIREKLRERHKYYMVDEYQDTNELQSELVMLLTNELESAKLFIVGDPKQSIYGFRGADVRVFEKTKQKIMKKRGENIRLTENFRSLRDTVGFVNYFFDSLMGDGTKTEFEVEYEPLTLARSVGANGTVEILLGKQGEDTENEYTLIAQHIKNMKVNENGVEGQRPIQYGDIAILIRSRRHLPDIEHALLEADIPYLTTGGVGFYQRQEIYDIWNYLNFLNKPTENQASLAAVLRGPAFGISDTELYEISLQEQEKSSFWDKAQNYQGRSHNLNCAITTLKKHSQLAHRIPVNQLIVTIVNETGMIGTLKAGKHGQQRLANYQKLLELARNFDGDENKRILPDFIEFLDILITEEPQEGQAPIEGSSGAVRIMTIHAAKGLQFPVVILPRLDRGGQIDREPFIDEVFGIGFRPLKPKDGYRKTEPEIVVLMKNRSSEKETAEKKRLFYVGATRAEDRLILSGTLSDYGKPQQMLEWLYEHLNLNEGNDSLRLPVELGVFADNHTTPESFQLQVPIYQTLAGTAPADEVPDETTPVDFPMPLQRLESTEIHASFSVPELANYARCPLRYQLENILRIPTNGQGESDPDENEMNAAVRYILARMKQPSDVENLDTLINQALENYPEVMTESTDALRTYVNNFINSELGESALSASTIRTNQQIHAAINEHIIDGRLDRLFRDETGDWQVINYKTDGVQNLDAFRPEMELYSLLVHRRYPSQSTVTINLFFTEHGQCEQMHFSAAQLREVQEQWQEKILALQRGVYEKNLAHCCSCPYANQDGQCIMEE